MGATSPDLGSLGKHYLLLLLPDDGRTRGQGDLEPVSMHGGEEFLPRDLRGDKEMYTWARTS